MPQPERELPARKNMPSGNPSPAGPCALVLFGGTGDLTARMLLPALYNLAKSKLLSPDFAIVGVGRNDYTSEQYRQIIGDKLQTFATGGVDPELRDWLIQRVYYTAGEFRDPQLYVRLRQTLSEIDKKSHNTDGNYFFYLATSPAFFGVIVEQLGTSGLAHEE